MAWDDICTRCGLCCHEKVIYPEYLAIDMNGPCEFFDEESKSCTVYDNRFLECARCMKVSLFTAMFSRSLPENCGYVQWARTHKIRFRKSKETVIIS